jgi:hypothetical protein
MTGTGREAADPRRTMRRAWARRVIRMLAVCGPVMVSVSVSAAGVAAAYPASTAAARVAAARAAAPAATLARYCGSRHVTVVVDFTHFRHGKIRTGCAKDPRTGLAALRQAGFTYTFVPRQPGFICTINHRPRKCNGAPASAYWSYWHARPHGRWRYSTLGAGSYHPRRGWIEGWAFGKGKPPHISPP